MGFDILNNIKNGLFSKTPSVPGTGLGLQDFYQTASERGFARDFHLRVTQIGDSKLSNEDLIYIRAAEVPARQIEQEGVHFRGFKFNVPMTVTYPGSDGWDVEFLMDKDYGIYNKLDAWHRKTYDENTFTGTEVPNHDKIISLLMLDDGLDVVRFFNLYGCFPVRLGALKFNMGGAGAPVSFTMTLAYQRFADTSITARASTPGLIDNIVKGLRKVSNVVQQSTNVIRSVRSIPGF